MNTPTKFRVALAGCGGMGKHQAKILAGSADYRLVGVCDADPARAEALGAELGVAAYADFEAMLSQGRPEVVAICTHNASHAPLTIAAAEAGGVKAVYCEKPMAVNMGEAKRMVAACAGRGVELVINHQRRIGPDLVAARRIIDAGELGTVRVLRAHHAGDLLSDGTHAIDSLMWLAGDRPVDWVAGLAHRELAELSADHKRLDAPRGGDGFRYGHVVEAGAVTIFQIKDGPRVEVYSGDLREDGTAYQDYTIHGDCGTLWRNGDGSGAGRDLYVSDAAGGDLEVRPVGYPLRPLPVEGGRRGTWRRVPLESEKEGGITRGYALLAERLRGGAPHPMCGELALRGFEVLMAAYESARRHRKIVLPLAEEEFPLELMLRERAALETRAAEAR